MVDEMLNPQRFTFMSVSHMVDMMRRRFGEMPLKIPVGLEVPYCLAFRKCHPQILVAYLDRIPKDEQLSFILGAGRFGLDTTRLARSIAMQGQLDPVNNLLNIAGHLRYNGSLISLIHDLRPQKSLTSQEINSFDSYLTLTLTEKAKFSRAIKLHRRLYRIIYPRIAYRHI